MFRVLHLLLLMGLTSARNVPFYRKDYHYFPEFDAFYKFHWNTGASSWLDAFIVCSGEGANLFYPSIVGEFDVVTNLTSLARDYNDTDIFVGIHDEFHVGEYVTVDGSSTPFPILEEETTSYKDKPCLLLDVVTGIYRISDCAPEKRMFDDGEVTVDIKKSFICKKTMKPKRCPTVDEGYSYSKTVGKCYKVIYKQKDWNDAYKHCYMEGATLSVPENDDEYREIINTHINSQPRSNYHPRATHSQYYNSNGDKEDFFIGIRQLGDGPAYENLFTIKGIPLEDGGIYQTWDPNNEVNNQDIGSQNCVAVTRQENYNNDNNYFFKLKSCVIPLPFVCEMKANS